MSSTKKHVLITGGAGYIGSLLSGQLLRSGYQVTVLDKLLFGGDSLLAYMAHPDFRFIKSDVWEERSLREALKGERKMPDALVHLAAIVGFPACQAVGKQVAWRYNVEATKNVYEQAKELGIRRFIFASSYSNYGQSDNGEAVEEQI